MKKMLERRTFIRSILLIVMIMGIYGVLACGCTKDNQKVDADLPYGGDTTETDAKKPDISDEGTLDNKEKKDVGEEKPVEDKYKDKAVVLDTVVDIFREADINSERVTQAIFNQPVTVLEEKDSWTKVVVVDGYTGWLKSKFIDRDCTSIMEGKYTDRVVITGKAKKVYSSAGGGLTLKDVVMGTELFIKAKKDRYYEVVLPGGTTGWIDTRDTIRVPVGSFIPTTSAQDFVATVDKFMGTPYLWGGVSSWGGLDCSGLVYICSRINGVDLPRDADWQFEFIKTEIGGTKELKPGDLLFFSSNEDLKDVSHVGIFVGGGKFIHATKSKGMVIKTDVETEYYIKRLKGIRRIFE